MHETDKNLLMRGHDGKLFDPLNIRQGAITIRGVARSLSRLPRFSGNCDHNYSVAEHCLIVSQLSGPEHALEGLLHDAHECILGDIPTPAKRILGERALDVDSIIEGEVRMQLGLSPRISKAVRATDKLAYLIEAPYAFKDLTAFVESGFPSLARLWVLTGAQPRDAQDACELWRHWAFEQDADVRYLNTYRSEVAFLERYEQLAGGAK